MEDKQMINEGLNRQMKNIERQYEEIRLEEKELKELIESTRRRIVSNQVKLQEAYQNFEELRTLREDLEKEAKSDLVKLILFLKVDLMMKLSTNEIRDYYYSLENRGYVQIEDYLFYSAKGEDELQYLTQEIIAEELEDVDRTLEFFDDLDLANMWLFDVSTKEAAEDLIIEQGWMSVMNIQKQGLVYRDIIYCINDERRYSFE